MLSAMRCHVQSLVYIYHSFKFFYVRKALLCNKLTNRSQLSSLGLTSHIILIIFLVSTSMGSGVTDFTDSAISGDIALERGGGGCLT